MEEAGRSAPALLAAQPEPSPCGTTMQSRKHPTAPLAKLDEAFWSLAVHPELEQSKTIPKGLTPDAYYRWQTRKEIHGEEYFAELRYTKQCLQEATHLCRYLELNNTPASIKEVTLYKSVLSAAIHEAEELYADIAMEYPVPDTSSITAASSKPMRHEKYLPQMLFHNNDTAVIYLPQQRTQRNAKGLPTSLHITEFRDFLLDADLPSLTDWQADFIHVFDPADAGYCRDVDNYEYKKYIDLLARKLGTVDSSTHFSLTMRNEFTTAIATGTYIIIRSRISALPTLLALTHNK